MVDRLAEDHARARTLASRLQAMPGMVLDPGSPYTNMVFVSLAEDVPLDGHSFAARLVEQGVKVGVVGARRFRLVTHCWIDDVAVERAWRAFEAVLQAA
jgi:threonine aldolase